MSMRKFLKISCSILIGAFMAVMGASKDAKLQDAADHYAQYIQARISATTLDAFAPYISTEMITARTKYVEESAAQKGVSPENIEQRLIERTKHAENCIGTRIYQDGKSMDINTVTLTYSFTDKCANADITNIEDVTMIREGGRWKINHVNIHPETQETVKKSFHLNKR